MLRLGPCAPGAALQGAGPSFGVERQLGRRRWGILPLDTWLVMRDDPVLPKAIIIRLRNPDRGEFFVTITWDLDSDKRHMIGRFDCELGRYLAAFCDRSVSEPGHESVLNPM